MARAAPALPAPPGRGGAGGTGTAGTGTAGTGTAGTGTTGAAGTVGSTYNPNFKEFVGDGCTVATPKDMNNAVAAGPVR